MADEIESVKGPSLDAQKLHMQAQEAKQASSVNIKQQVASQESLTTFAELGEEFNPLAMGKDFRELDKRAKADTQGAAKAKEEAQDPEVAQKVAKSYNEKNPELNERSLLAVKAHIKPTDSREQILGKVRDAYPDPSLADDTLDFLIETTPEGSALKAKLQSSKEQLNEVYGREVRAGKNIKESALQFSKEGLGSPTALRDLYRDITGNPRDPNTLYEELASKFDFPSMKSVMEFILHSLGNDLKAKGPSIPGPELQRLFSETRTMQAILGVYRFFFQRMGLVQAEFSRADLTMPTLVNFQMLAKAFMRMIKERYPSADRVLLFATMLGISEETAAKIVIFNQFRDALRNVSPKLFKSDKHRQDLLMTLIEALSELEDEYDEEYEDEDEEDEE
ncbi:MAG: hypothetical protein S4CHLAM37_09050 [Chlamydiia bacterium]|nr:hypothetical protein [Chlamydiia bacterium]